MKTPCSDIPPVIFLQRKRKRKKKKMHIFGDIRLIEDYVRPWRSSWWCQRIFQPKYAKDSKYIWKSIEEHLLHFSNQIVIVEDIKMAQIKEGLIPRKVNQWLNKATDLKCKVSDALKKRQNSKDPSVEYTKLKDMCDEIFNNMKDCPVEDVNDKPMAFIAQMHETEDGSLPDSSLLPSEDGLEALDVDKEVAASDEEVVLLLESYGVPQIMRIEYTLTSDNMGGEGESSQVRDAMSLEISAKGSSSRYISELKDENTLKITEEGDRSLRRLGKKPIVETGSDIVLRYSIITESQPELKVSTREDNQTQLRVDTRSSNSQEIKHHIESELSMMVQILLTGEMSEYADLRLQIIRMSPTRATFNLNNDFGLHPKMDSYLFSAMKKPAELEPDSKKILMANGASLLPENLIVNRSGSKELLADEEWRLAGVVNLTGKKIYALNEEPHCLNLVILFLQRNSRLTDICSSFFNQMPALRFLDLSDTRIKALPSSLFKLTNLQLLLLRNCLCLDSLPPEIKNLINMEALDLFGTELSHLPNEMSELTKLRYLQLSFYQADSQSELVSLGVVIKWQVLQGLSIVVHPEDQGWKNIVGNVIKQVGKLKMLRYLQFYFPTVEALISFSKVSLSWREHRLKSFKFLVGHNIKRIISRVPDEVESKYGEYDRCLRYVNGIEVPEMMKNVLERVTAFYLDHHLEIESLSDFDISILKELRFCVLRECPNIHMVIKREKRTESAFPNLEYLALHYLWKLEQIWEDPIPPGSYQALKYLMVSTCGKLEFIASHAVLQCLSNLETFIIEDCESLKSIVKETERVKYDEPLLPRLKELVLRHLPQLVALGRGLFPSEKIIKLHFCPKLVLSPDPNKIEWKKLLRL